MVGQRGGDSILSFGCCGFVDLPFDFFGTPASPKFSLEVILLSESSIARCLNFAG